MLLVTAFMAGWLGGKVPSSFLPEEDQGYAFVGVQLPDAASLQRTDAACKKIEDIIMKTPGVQYCSAVAGYSLLSGVTNTYSGFFFVTLKEWSERKTPEEQYNAITRSLNAKLSQIPDGIAFAFSPPAIQGVGTSGGFTFVLEDRAGNDIPFLAENLGKFMEAARKRPELAQLSTTFLPIVPQVYVNVDRDKVLKQGIDIGAVYQTLQTFMGGYFINYFNRFGRQWQVYIQAEGDARTNAKNVGQFYVRNDKGTMAPLASVINIQQISGPEFTMRYNLYRSHKSMEPQDLATVPRRQ